MSNTVDMPVSKPADPPIRRIEVFTGAECRRNWSAEEKAAIVAESYNTGDSICGVARRHGLTHSQLFAWRRQARLARERQTDTPPLFVPAIVETPARKGRKRQGTGSRPTHKSGRAPALVEVEIDGMTVRVGAGADAETVAAVIRALKAGA